MRTTADLIKELVDESRKFVSLNLVVGFETECKMINAKETDALQRLNKLVKAGGEPIGFIGVLNEATQAKSVLAKVVVRTVKEYDSHPGIKAALERVAEAFGHQMRLAGAKIHEDKPGHN